MSIRGACMSDAEAREMWSYGRAKRTAPPEEQQGLRQVGGKIEVEDRAWSEQGAGGVSKQVTNIAVRRGSGTFTGPPSPFANERHDASPNETPALAGGYTLWSPVRPGDGALPGRDSQHAHDAQGAPAPSLGGRSSGEVSQTAPPRNKPET